MKAGRYGYVTPENLVSVLRGSQRWGPLWRGRLGISETEAVQERRSQAELQIACNLLYPTKNYTKNTILYTILY